MPHPPGLTYQEVADLLEQHFNTRVNRSTLRAAAHRRDQSSSTASITAGIPEPLPRQQGLPAEQVYRWIENHPWKAREAALRALRASTSDEPSARITAVDDARRAGLSWREIAHAISETDQVTYTRQAAQQKFSRKPRR